MLSACIRTKRCNFLDVLPSSCLPPPGNWYDCLDVRSNCVLLLNQFLKEGSFQPMDLNPVEF